MHSLAIVRDSQGNFTADPQCAAEHCSQEWKREWCSEDTIGFKETRCIRAPREMHVELARQWACNPDLQAENVRKACLTFPASTSTHSKTSLFSLTILWTLWVRSSYNVLSSWQYQPSHFYNFGFHWARKTEGAEQSPSHTAHIASPCVWSQHPSINGMSSVLVSGILRSTVTQRSEHMLRGLRASDWPTAKQHKRTLADSATYGKGLLCRDFGFGRVDTQVTEIDVFKLASCASSTLAGCLSFDLVQSLEYVVLGSVFGHRSSVTIRDGYEPHASVARCGTVRQSSERPHNRGGPNLVWQIDSLGDKSLGKLIVGHIWAEGVPICPGAADLVVETAAEKVRCAANQWKRTWV